MKNKKSIILFILVSFFSKGYSQGKISGIVFNEENKPIGKAVINYKLNSLSTISNQEGRFEIPISYIKNDTLIISYIGHKSEKISDYRENPDLEILLENKYKTIDEIVITPMTVEAILDSILANIPKNYYDNCLYTGTYKEGNFKNDSLNKYSEASIQIDILKNGENKIFMDTDKSFKYHPIPSAEHFIPTLPNVIKNLEAVSIVQFIKSNMANYKIKSSRSIYDDRPVTLITLKKQEESEKLVEDYYIKLVIDKENFALLQYSNYFPANKIFSSPNIVLTSLANNLEINYRLFENKYILSSINGEFIGKSTEKIEKNSITSYFGFIITDFCISKCSYFKKTINTKNPITKQIISPAILANFNIQNKKEYELLKNKN